MKKGMEYQGVVEKIDFPNKGTVDCGEEGVALVKRTIPGQSKFCSFKETFRQMCWTFKRST